MLDGEAREQLAARIGANERRATELAGRLAEPELADLPEAAPDLTGLLAELDQGESNRAQTRPST